jgi:hypothetical protein
LVDVDGVATVTIVAGLPSVTYFAVDVPGVVPRVSTDSVAAVVTTGPVEESEQAARETAPAPAKARYLKEDTFTKPKVINNE